jgi:hypothetical protein
MCANVWNTPCFMDKFVKLTLQVNTHLFAF